MKSKNQSNASNQNPTQSTLERSSGALSRTKSSCNQRPPHEPKARRTKGSGCIYKRDQDGATVYGGYITRNGEREYVDGLFSTRTQVEKELTKLKKQVPRAKTLMTLADWIQHLLENDFSGSHVWASATWVLGEGYWRNFIAPSRLGKMRIDQIVRRDVQAFVDEIVAMPRAPSTVRRIGAVVSKALSVAWDANLIPNNPAFRVKYPPIPETRKRTLTISESAHFTELVASPRLKAMFQLKIDTGMRRQEVCGLHWDYIDKECMCLRLKTALTAATGVLEEKELKEKRKLKTIPICQETLELLLAQPRRSQFVFTTDSGMPVAMDNFQRDLNQLKARAKKRGIDLEGLTLHGIRASYATNQTRQGVDVKTVSEILGHHKASYTQDKYVMTDEETKRSAQDKLMDKLMAAKAAPPEWKLIKPDQIQNGMVGGTGLEPVTPTVSL